MMTSNENNSDTKLQLKLKHIRNYIFKKNPQTQKLSQKHPKTKISNKYKCHENMHHLKIIQKINQSNIEKQKNGTQIIQKPKFSNKSKSHVRRPLKKKIKKSGYG